MPDMTPAEALRHVEEALKMYRKGVGVDDAPIMATLRAYVEWRPASEAPLYRRALVFAAGQQVAIGEKTSWGWWADHGTQRLDPQPTHYLPLPPAPGAKP